MAEQGLHEELGGKLLAWYDVHARDLPWRSKPGARPDPYHVWLSEIMLQQTTVAAVRDYYLKFLRLWPTVEDLAAASQDDVLRAWAGLGYYARARNLHACAQEIVSGWNGRFPAHAGELQTLPGIGPYTAAAIASIAFDRRHAAVDGNVERVISRLYAIETPLPAAKPLIREKAQALVPSSRAGDFAQALMDLGATICTPRSPNCQICPWTDHCAGRKLGIAASLPRKCPRQKIPTRKAIAFWIERRDGSCPAAPEAAEGPAGWHDGSAINSVGGQTQAANAVPPRSRQSGKSSKARVEHTFTHFHLELGLWKAMTSDRSLPEGDYSWVRLRDLEHEALPSLMRKVVALATSANLVDMR